MYKHDISNLIELLKKEYPDAKCSLNFDTPFQLLISVMLSAQCTDERVNKTTSELFKNYRTPEDFINLDIKKLEKLIHPCGFYRTKAKHIKECSLKIVNDYNGQVPQSIDDLIKLPGIGRKSANVIMSDAFHTPVGIAVDTHVKRVSKRIGLTNNIDPIKVEIDLLQLFDIEHLSKINHLLIFHGRKICTAKNPKCYNCPLNSLCDKNLK